MQETKKEPTTAELFAIVREAVQIGADNVETTSGKNAMEDATTAIALLERRMVAMERGMTLIAAYASEQPTDSYLVGLVSAAITDAPPVFTLEEVVQLVHEAYTPWVSRDDVRESVQHHHAAMRR